MLIIKQTLFLFILFLPISLYAQWIPDKLLSSPKLPEGGINEWSASLDMTGFFKNNEYFNPLEPGRTLPGINFIPKVSYQTQNRFRAELGMYNIYYSGEQHNDEEISVFDGVFIRLQYAIKPEFNLVFGNIYGGLNHRLIEPLYKWERSFTDKPESGLQLIYDNDRYFVDVWTDWQRYIEYGDSLPEILTVGVSASMQLSDNKNTSLWKFSVPFQLLVHHRGGQIDVSRVPTVVIGNVVSGFCMERSFESGFVNSLALKAYFAGYYDKLPDKEARPYDKGWGVYPVMEAKASDFAFMMGYWYAKEFYAFQGEPLFSSFNPRYPDVNVPERRLLTTKLIYSKQLQKNLALGAQIETYTDFVLKSTNYSAGIYLRFNGNFIFKK